MAARQWKRCWHQGEAPLTVLARMGVDPQEALKIARVTMGPVKMAPKPDA